MMHDWVKTPREKSFSKRIVIPLSMHIDYTRKPFNPDDVKRWTCSRCGFDMETNLPPDEYKKAPDCDQEIIRHVLLT